MATLERESYGPTADYPAGRWTFNWSAIVAGVAVTLGLLTLLLLLGTALGLSTMDPYRITINETSNAWSAATIVWIIVSAIASMFFGALVIGYWSRLQDAGEASLNGAIGWSLTAAILGLALGGVATLFGTGATATVDRNEAVSAGYSSLNDPQFANFVLERARNWRPGSEEKPIEVTAETRQRVDPDDVSDNDDLQRFVQSNTRLNEDQAETFLEQEKSAIANEQAAAQQRWEQAHAQDLAQADRARRVTSAAAWTLTGAAFLSLVAAVGASFLGWWLRGRGYGEGRGHYMGREERIEPTPKG